MRKQEVKEMIEEMGLPFAYGAFPEGKVPKCPYIIFRYPKDSNFAADNAVYAPFEDLDIELYCLKRDISLEERIEEKLSQREVFYRKSEIYIESEKMYEVLYETEMVVMG